MQGVGMAKVVVNPLRCEGAKACAQQCPETVFAMQRAPPTLPLLVRIKVAVHGGRQAVVVNEAACTACMKCVEICPERAITVLT
jgi:NAD-dependent dihydropyrimidine dehydrogenase PreA subunit